MPRHTIALATLATIATFATACDQRRLAATGDVQADHSEDRASVIGTDSNGTSIRGSTDPLTGNDCIIIGDDCLAPEAAGAFCERDGGPYDIIVVEGEVVDIICYPPADDGQTTVVDGDGDIAVPQNENNTTVTFDDATNGTPIEGVVLDGNNVRLRGLTIDGNLTVPKNSLAAVREGHGRCVDQRQQQRVGGLGCVRRPHGQRQQHGPRARPRAGRLRHRRHHRHLHRQRGLRR